MKTKPELERMVRDYNHVLLEAPEGALVAFESDPNLVEEVRIVCSIEGDWEHVRIARKKEFGGVPSHSFVGWIADMVFNKGEIAIMLFQHREGTGHYQVADLWRPVDGKLRLPPDDGV